MKYKAIIFDMDGTIIDTEHIWQEATRQVIVNRGVVYTQEMRDELHRRKQGHALHQSSLIMKEVAGLRDDAVTLSYEKAAIADALFEEGIRFIQGFEDFHAQAVALNLKTGVATNATDQTVAITDRKLNLRKFFGEHIYHIGHVENRGKPNPALYLLAARELGVTPAECLVIEDSANGIVAAKAAGMYCFGINTAGTPELLKHADAVINGYHEIDLSALL